MKIRHGIIISIVLFIGLTILGDEYLPIDFRLNQMLITILSFLWLISLGLVAYLIIRNIIRAIKGIVTKPREGR